MCSYQIIVLMRLEVERQTERSTYCTICHNVLSGELLRCVNSVVHLHALDPQHLASPQ